MSKFLSLIALLLITSITYAQGISFFHGSWEEALEEAKKTDKVIFVDAYAKWCGPCKVMAKNVFTKKEVGDYFNENFISLKLDMEEKEGISFGRKFPISAYPTLFFISSEGELIQKSVGGKKTESLLALAKKTLGGFDKSGQYVESYEEGNRDFDLMVNYVRELNKVGKPSLKISNEYIDSDPQITEAQKAEFLLTAVTESDSKIFGQLISLKKEAIRGSSEKEFNEKVEAACLETVEKAVEYEFEDLLHDAINNYKSAKTGEHKRFDFIAKLKYNELMGNFAEWHELSKSFLKKYGKKDPSQIEAHLNTLKNSFNYVSENSEYASALAKQLVKADDSTRNYMSYIQMLVKCENHKEAKKMAKEALKKAKKREESTKQLEQYLEFLEKEVD